MRVEFTIPGPPRSWKRRNTGRSRSTGKSVSFNDPKYEQHKKHVAWLMLQHTTESERRFIRGSRLSLQLAMYFPSFRVQDADRVLNLILDAGKSLFWVDDTWTTFEGGEIVLRPALDRKNPRVEVIVECIAPLTREMEAD